MQEVRRPERPLGRHKDSHKDIDQYRSTIANKYGEEFLEEFDTVYQGYSISSLTDISKKYGFSKVRAGQIFKSLYGMNLREARALVKRPEEDLDHYARRGEGRLFVAIDIGIIKKLDKYATSHRVTKASIVQKCLTDFLEGDAYSRISF